MFGAKEYSKRLKEIGLSASQTKQLRAVLEEMMTLASRTANSVYRNGTKLSPQDERFNRYFEGKSDGLNAFDRFLRGDMDCHDEFEKEKE